MTPAAEEPRSQAPDFERVVEENADFVYNVALRMMGNPEEAEDVAQDAFLSAYRAYGSFRGESKASTWLYRVTVNAALMRLRKTKPARDLTQAGLDEIEVADWSASPHDEAVNAELREALTEGLKQLEPSLRVAVVLRDVQGLSSTEAAEALDISVPALKSRLHRARVLLRQRLSSAVAAQT